MRRCRGCPACSWARTTTSPGRSPTCWPTSWTCSSSGSTATPYEFEGESRPLELIEEEIAVKGRAEPERLVVRETHHGPIVNEALRADDAEPLALRFMALDFPGLSPASLGVLDFTSGADLVQALGEHAHPVSNLVWADRHGSIGYKTVGRLPVRRGGCPDLPKPGWTGEHEWDGWVPYEELPELTDPDQGFVVTANNRVAPEDYPHHITSDYLDGYRARRIEQLIAAEPEHDLESFEAMQTDMLSLPGLEETAHRLARLPPRDQRELAAIERLRSWDGRMSPESIAATIYQAFTLRLAREVARAAIGDHDLAERWLDRADNGFIAHVTSPWRWQSHLLALWDEGDEEPGRPALGRARPRCAARGSRRPGGQAGRGPGGLALGRSPPARLPARARRGESLFGWIFNRRLEVGGGQETVAQVGWDPNDPFTAIWAPCWRMVADPVRPERSRWQGFTGQSGHPRARTTTTSRATGSRGGPADGRRGAVARADARARGRHRVSRRDQIKLSDDEQRELLESERVVVVSSIGPRGWPHSMPLWYVLRGNEIWIYTYAKSQKVKNLERDPRATLLVETGHEYGELRGVQIEAEAEIHRDLELVYEVGKELTLRYAEGPRSRGRRPRRSRPRLASGSRSASSRGGSRAGTTGSSGGTY